ncbi:unnamed protein product, partial [Ectocarpus sp. 13 AM-2016]
MYSEHARWMLDSASQRRRSTEEYQRLKAEGSPGQRQFDEAAKKQVEVYVGNVPHGTLAPDLAKFL